VVIEFFRRKKIKRHLLVVDARKIRSKPLEEVGSRSRSRMSAVLIGIEVGCRMRELGPERRTSGSALSTAAAAFSQPRATSEPKLDTRTIRKPLGPLPRGFAGKPGYSTSTARSSRRPMLHSCAQRAAKSKFVCKKK
jgi:hypothetical protein